MKVHAAALAAPYVLAVQALSTVAQVLAAVLYPLTVAASLASVAAVLCYLVHARRLCEYCVGYLPPDPDAAVADYRPALHWCHRPQRRLLGLTVLGLTFTLPVLPTAAALVLLVVASAFWAADLRADTWHRRLQPWCPWCRGRGDFEATDTPDPRLLAAR